MSNSVGFLLEELEAFLQTRNLQLNLDVIGEQIRNFALSGISYILNLLGTSLTNLINFVLIASACTTPSSLCCCKRCVSLLGI
jgi:hypothetical protein